MHSHHGCDNMNKKAGLMTEKRLHRYEIGTDWCSCGW